MPWARLWAQITPRGDLICSSRSDPDPLSVDVPPGRCDPARTRLGRVTEPMHPIDPTSSAAAPTRPSRAALIAGLLTVVEGLILLAFAGFYVYEIALGAEDSLTTALTSAALIVIFGVALLVVARAWLRGQRWPRTPTLVWNVLLLPVAWSLRDSDQTLIAAGIAALAVASIVAALASPAHRLAEPGSAD
jgi:hypothetical protein